MKRFGQLLMLLLVALVALLAAEVMLRSTRADRLPAFFAATHAPGGVPTYGLRADTTQVYLHRNREVQVTIGPNGMRMHGTAAGGIPVHMIGDSQVFGWGLNDTETIPALVQASLGAAFQVINHGLPGGGPHYYASELARLPPTDAAVVVFTETNDLQDTYSPLPFAVEHCGFIVVPNGFAHHMPCFVLRSQLYGLLVDWSQEFLPAPIPLPLCYNPHLQVPCSLAMYRALDRVSQLAARRTGPTIFLTIPWEGRVDPEARLNYRPLVSQPISFAGKQEWPHYAAALDALNRLGPSVYQVGDHHLSGTGARAIAGLAVELVCTRFAAHPVAERTSALSYCRTPVHSSAGTPP